MKRYSVLLILMAQLVSSQGFEYGVKHFYNSNAGQLISLVASVIEKTEPEVESLLNLGAIYINNQRQNQNLMIEANQLFRVHTKPRRFNCDYNWTSLIIFENKDFLVLNKPSGIPSHPSVDNILDNALHQTAVNHQCPLYITHRLDTLTEGLIVYAKTNDFVKEFNKQMNSRLIEKKYVALVETTQNLPHRLIHYMEPSPRAPKKVSQTANEGWAFCELEVLEQKKISLDTSWIKINLLTGRTHQIRSQCSEVGAPILGDKLYGSKLTWSENAIALRACELQFTYKNQLMEFKLNEDFKT